MKIFLLLVAFQAKHFLADFPLQNPYMLGKFNATGWVKPLAAHCAVHAFFTYFICLAALLTVPGGFGIALGLALFDFGIHFIMDRVKASPKMLGRYKSLDHRSFRIAHLMLKEFPETHPRHKNALMDLRDNVFFWWCLGLDQMVHHLTHYAIIWCLV